MDVCLHNQWDRQHHLYMNVHVYIHERPHAHIMHTIGHMHNRMGYHDVMPSGGCAGQAQGKCVGQSVCRAKCVEGKWAGMACVLLWDIGSGMCMALLQHFGGGCVMALGNSDLENFQPLFSASSEWLG